MLAVTFLVLDYIKIIVAHNMPQRKHKNNFLLNNNMCKLFIIIIAYVLLIAAATSSANSISNIQKINEGEINQKRGKHQCVTSVRIGTSPAAGTLLPCPWKEAESFYFVFDPQQMDTIRAHGWTPVLLNVLDIPFDPLQGPTEMPELSWTTADTENMQAKYVKILSHMIAELRGCELVLYLDSKISLTFAQVRGLFDRFEAESNPNTCAALFQHQRTYYGAYFQEVDDSYRQPRYLRFKPAIDKEIAFHRGRQESFDGVMHVGNMHIFNLTNTQAVQFQKSWWKETVAYSIQDQLSQFWQLEPFKDCLLSWKGV